MRKRGYLKYKYLPKYDLSDKNTYDPTDDTTSGRDTELNVQLPSMQLNTSSEYYKQILDLLLKDALENMGTTAASSIVLPITTTVANSMAKSAANTSASGAASGAASGVGKALGALQAAYGTFNMIRGFADMKNNIASSSDIASRATTLTNNVNGVAYNAYGGIDVGNEMRMFRKKEQASRLKNTTAGMSAGAGLGSMFGPLGTAIGGVAGAITGFFGSLFGGGHRKRKLERRIRNVNFSNTLANRQSMSVAKSLSVLNDYYKNNNPTSTLYSADNGKDSYRSKTDEKHVPAFGKVWTPEGEQYGPINGRIGKGESLWDFVNGTASYVSKGVKRADDLFTSAQNGDHIYIAGNDIDLTNGISFADLAAKPAQEVEKTNKLIDKILRGNGSDKTKELNLTQANLYKLQLLKEGKEIMNRLKIQHNMYNTMPMGSYDVGKDYITNSILTSIPSAFGLATAINLRNMYKNSPISSQSPYARNESANTALNELNSLRYDPYNSVNAINDAYRQGLYGINNGGALSPGQKMVLRAALNNSYMSNLSDTYAAANETNNKYRQQYAQALLLEGARDAAARQQANQVQQERVREATAQRLRGIESANQGILNSISGFTKNLFDNYLQYKSEQYNNKMLDLYAKEGGINSEDNNVQTPVNKKPIEINLRKLGRQFRREAKQNAKNAFYNKLVKPTLPQLKYNLFMPLNASIPGINPFSRLDRMMQIKSYMNNLK
ncbi:hypothetical protein [uncultured phage cr130_1]|uniref:Uncharacterized protein n=1 Tax=uncultured phage cr130_1 TaxID=2772092 RepID=A0A7M1RTH1_9CAUD|nr:hypothetical protein KNV59_gp77 [uncultured phage cr130_1]QOR57628.1 hypothetical protein [uncultured phage cr130_1]